MLVIRGTDFETVRLGDLGGVPIRFIPARIAQRKTLQPLDLLIETAGGSKDRSTGRTVLVTPELLSRASLPVTCASFSRFLRIDPEKADPRFIFWLLQALYEGGQIRQYHTQHTGVARFQFTTFADREPLSLPPLPIQRRVASALSEYDDLIENNTRRITILEEMARALYREWFLEFRFPGHEKVEMVESGDRSIPAGWTIERTADAFDFCGGATPSTSEPTYWEGGAVVWYSPSDLTKAGTIFVAEGEKRISEAGLGACSARLFPPYSVMMTSRATLGVLAINTVEACTNQGFITCIPNPRVTCPHLYLWLDASAAELEQLGTGATFKEITKRAFREFPILIAPEQIERAFHAKVWPLFQFIENLVAKNHNLRSTRDLLLPKLISGEVEIPLPTEDRSEP
ncbi:MAG: restriction endonuclease subunit S [Acidobacteria bacterium]|nr:MAG: restriction endonuclease subunit S [Acidobacteriota bacterium]MCE7956468.1 restriction endonuclease subunit S [Acidobacteria bacterium ACB2]